MKVILLQDVKAQGKKGDIIDVSDGYARNFLFKNKLAVEASSGSVNEIQQKKAAEVARKKKELEEAKAFAARINGSTVTVAVKAGEAGKIFGSVGTKEIAAALCELGFAVDKKGVLLKEPIKQVGRVMVDVKVYANVVARVNVNVVAE